LAKEFNMESKLQIFVSSTFTDLIDERQAAVQAILKSGHIPAGMELFIAGDKSQWDVIQRWITDCDVYMLILGGRYGSIEPDSGISYTELEYDFAVGCGKPHFAVVIADNALEEKVKIHGSCVLETDNPDKLKKFRTKVLSKMSSFYSDTKDVKIAVLETVPQLASEYGIRGWVRAAEIPDTKALADELSRLHTENKELESKLVLATKKNESAARSVTGIEKEFTDLFDLLSATMIDMTTARIAFGNTSSIPDKVSVLDLFLSTRDVLMKGVENQMGMGDLEKFIFFTLAPKLQTYDLAENQKITGVKYRRYCTTKKGSQFLAFVDKLLHKTAAITGEPTIVKKTPAKKTPAKKTPAKKAPTRKY
jgi:hypothetical protein